MPLEWKGHGNSWLTTKRASGRISRQQLMSTFCWHRQTSIFVFVFNFLRKTTTKNCRENFGMLFVGQFPVFCIFCCCLHRKWALRDGHGVSIEFDLRSLARTTVAYFWAYFIDNIRNKIQVQINFNFGIVYFFRSGNCRFKYTRLVRACIRIIEMAERNPNDLFESRGKCEMFFRRRLCEYSIAIESFFGHQFISSFFFLIVFRYGTRCYGTYYRIVNYWPHQKFHCN